VGTALYRKYRSKSLAEVVGQGHITDILTKALASGRIAHAYLLTGPRGVGKTSIARILAHEINELPYTDDATHLDIIEIDAASNNGVDDVRDLREKVQIAPTSAKKKVYIIDEVHMLSKSAFNALLKTLEEPPEHVVFILATTDADKLPATIVSRTQRYGFRAIGTDDTVTHLKHIAKEEKILIDDDALQLIAERADGSFRDSISLLDQLAGLADAKTAISRDLIEQTLGLAPSELIAQILEAIAKHDIAEIAKLLNGATGQGISASTLAQQLTQDLRVRILEKPAYLDLLDSLLDVAKSSQPDIKLLSVLGTYSLKTKPVRTAALATPVLEVSATIESLAKAAVPVATPVVKAPEPSRTQTTRKAAPKIAVAEVAVEPVKAKPVAPAIIATDPFDSKALIEYAREHYVAIYSVLAKCGYALNDNVLTIFTGNAFYKKKLDEPKYSVSIHESIVALGYPLITIEIVPESAPLKSSQAAAVAAIMGGGEEVSPETS